MGIQAIPYQRLVVAELGLVASGTTDGAGTWNTVNLGAYLTSKGYAVPQGATGVVVEVVNSSTSNQWGGIRAKGKTNPHILRDVVARAGNEILVPFSDNTTEMDFYLESTTNIQFYVKGYTDDSVVYFDADNLPSIPSTGSTWLTVTAALADPNSLLLMGAVTTQARPTGETAYTWINSSPTRLYPKLDANRQFDLSSGTDTQYWGFMRDFDQFASRTVQFTPPAADATYRTAPVSYPGKAAVLLEIDYNGFQVPMFFRTIGASLYAPNMTHYHGQRHKIVPLDVNGEFEYAVGTTWILGTNVTVVGTIDQFGAAEATLDFPDTFYPGQIIDLTSRFSGFGGIITDITFEDANNNSIVVPVVGGNSVTIPTLGVGESTTIQFGECSVYVTVGQNSASDTAQYIANPGYEFVTIDVPFVGAGNISNGWDQPLATGDQVYYSTANNTTIYNDGRFSTDNLTNWSAHAIYTDGVVESFNVEYGSQTVAVEVQADEFVLGRINNYTATNIVPISASIGGMNIPISSPTQLGAVSFVNGQAYPLFGTRDITFSDGTNDIVTSVLFKAGDNLSSHVLTTIANGTPGNISYYIDCVVGDIIISQSPESLSVAVNGVLPDGTIVSDAGGTQTWYHQRASDGLITELSVQMPNIDQDTIPDQFVFDPVNNVTISTPIQSTNTIIVSGVTAGINIPISTTNGLQYQYSTDGISWSALTDENGFVQGGYSVRVVLESSSSYENAVSGDLTIGTVTATFTVTTMIADVIPDQFVFDPVINAASNTVIASTNTIVLAGVSPGIDIPISTTNGLQYQYSTDGISWSALTTSPGNVRLGYLIRVALMSSTDSDTSVSGDLIINTVSATFTVTTANADVTPDQMSFATVNNANIEVLVESNVQTVTGIDSGIPIPISISGSGAVYAINSGAGFGEWSNAAATIQLGDQIKIGINTTDVFSSTMLATININGMVANFEVNIRDIDETPDSIIFAPVFGAELSTDYTSESATISGMDDQAVILLEVTNGLLNKNGGAFVSSQTFVNGDLIRLRGTSSDSFAQATTVTLSLSGQTFSTFSVTTKVSDNVETKYEFDIVASLVDDICDFF